MQIGGGTETAKSGKLFLTQGLNEIDTKLPNAKKIFVWGCSSDTLYTCVFIDDAITKYMYAWKGGSAAASTSVSMPQTAASNYLALVSFVDGKLTFYAPTGNNYKNLEYFWLASE